MAASFKTVSRAETIISLISFGKVFLCILALNFVSSCRSQSEEPKGDSSIRLHIALAVELFGVIKSWLGAVITRSLL